MLKIFHYKLGMAETNLPETKMMFMLINVSDENFFMVIWMRVGEDNISDISDLSVQRSLNIKKLSFFLFLLNDHLIIQKKRILIDKIIRPIMNS